MSSPVEYKIRFTLDPPNSQQSLDAVRTSLAAIGVTIDDLKPIPVPIPPSAPTQVDQLRQKLSALDGTIVQNEVSLKQFIAANGLTAQSVEQVISKLEAERKTLALGTADHARLNSQISSLRGAYGSLGNQLDGVGSKSIHASMGVTSFSQGLQDAPQFAYGFSNGMRSIGNNLEGIVGAFGRTAAEAKAMGVSFGSLVAGSLMGPAGLILAVNAAVTALSILPGLFSDTNKEAKNAADDGLSAITSRFQGMSSASQKATLDMATSALQRTQTQIDSLEEQLTKERLKQAEQIAATQMDVGQSVEEKRILGEIAGLTTVRDRRQEILDKYKEQLASSEEMRIISKEHADNLRAQGDQYQINQIRLDEITAALKDQNTKMEDRRKLRAEQEALEKKQKELVETDRERAERLKREGKEQKDTFTERLAILKEQYALHDLSKNQFREQLTHLLALAKTERERLQIRREIPEVDQAQTKNRRGAPQTDLERDIFHRWDMPGTPYAGLDPSQYPTSTKWKSGNTPAGSIADQKSVVTKLQDQMNTAVLDSDRRRIAAQLLLEQDKLDKMSLSQEEYSKKHRKDSEEAVQAYSIVATALQKSMHAAFAGESKSVGEFFKSILNGFIDMVEGIILAAAAAGTAKGILTFGTSLAGDLALVAASFATLEIARGVVNSFARGGEVTQPTLSLLGDAGPEIVAPTRTFMDVLRTDIIPRIVDVTREVSFAQPQMAFAGSGSSDMMREFKGLRRDLRDKDMSTSLPGLVTFDRAFGRTAPRIVRQKARERK